MVCSLREDLQFINLGFFFVLVPNSPCTGGLPSHSTLLLSWVGRGKTCATSVTDGINHSSSSPAIRGDFQEHNMPDVHATPSTSQPCSSQTPWQTMNSHNLNLTGHFPVRAPAFMVLRHEVNPSLIYFFWYAFFKNSLKSCFYVNTKCIS